MRAGLDCGVPYADLRQLVKRLLKVIALALLVPNLAAAGPDERETRRAGRLDGPRQGRKLSRSALEVGRQGRELARNCGREAGPACAHGRALLANRTYGHTHLRRRQVSGQPAEQAAVQESSLAATGRVAS